MNNYGNVDANVAEGKKKIIERINKKKKEVREKLKEWKDWYEFKPKEKGKPKWSFQVKVVIYIYFNNMLN